ncbi:hypothetical protein HPB50_014337 [Hyalomma asiaticum]|uniref:Uncharacterized protein n=1 Tax=Hyalomma asiaticum TaxID=266040 RepID=A0ACB7SF18_HYAAI|nr:hypothetical protein HPB50_014337 [Hyalomma asiaticum]
MECRGCQKRNKRAAVRDMKCYQEHAVKLSPRIRRPHGRLLCHLSGYRGETLLSLVNVILKQHKKPDSFRVGRIVLPLKEAAPPNEPASWRPITLLNVDYKIVASIINSRLKALLPNNTSPFQSCAVPGRVKGGSDAYIEGTLQAAVDAIEKQVDGLRTVCSPSKSELLVVPPKGVRKKERDPRRDREKITIRTSGGQVIPHVEKIRVLGMLLERNRANGETVNRLTAKVNSAIRLIRGYRAEGPQAWRRPASRGWSKSEGGKDSDNDPAMVYGRRRKRPTGRADTGRPVDFGCPRQAVPERNRQVPATTQHRSRRGCQKKAGVAKAARRVEDTMPR